MIKNSILFSVLVVFFTLVVSCQKENYDSPNSLKLSVSPPLNIGGTTYQLSGNIISSGNVRLSDHGFDVIAGTSTLNFPLGQKNVPGKVQTTINVPGGTTISDVVFYAFDQQGNKFVSTGYTSTGTGVVAFSNPLNISNQSHTTDYNFDYFNGVIVNNYPNDYTVMEYGVEYIDASATVYSRYPFYAGPVANATISINNQSIPYNTIFSGYTSYTYHLYVVVMRNSDGAVATFFNTQEDNIPATL